jgi:hypothetical protein
VSEKYIVTAAHCVSDLHHRKNEVAIYVGITSAYSTFGTVLTIRKIHIDPEFTAKMDLNEKNRHDFSVVKVNKIVIWNILCKKDLTLHQLKNCCSVFELIIYLIRIYVLICICSIHISNIICKKTYDNKGYIKLLLLL